MDSNDALSQRIYLMILKKNALPIFFVTQTQNWAGHIAPGFAISTTLNIAAC